eukprot:scaffold2198_cov353-Prasinococcus_capsulatus_cf.AAC.3
MVGKLHVVAARTGKQPATSVTSRGARPANRGAPVMEPGDTLLIQCTPTGRGATCRPGVSLGCWLEVAFAPDPLACRSSPPG